MTSDICQSGQFDLRSARINAGYSVAGLARHLGIGQQAISRLEAGLPVRPANAKVIADFFGVLVTDLMPLPNGDEVAA